MKIAIVTPSFNGGGAERIAVNLANYYAREGHEVHMVVFRSVGPYVKDLSIDLKLHEINSEGGFPILKVLTVLMRVKPNATLSVIRGSNIVVGFAGFFLASRIVFREASTMNSVLLMGKLKSAIYRALMRISYSRADLVIANSDDTKSDLIKCGILRSEKCVVIGNPVLPCDFFRKSMEQVDSHLFRDPSFKIVLAVGRLHKLKNHSLLIRAFAYVYSNMPNARLLIVGDGDELSNLVSLVASLNLSDVVEILSFQLNPFPYYRNADVFVLTSDWEGFGNVIVEAMACDTPIIATDCPGGPSMITNNGEFGVLVPTGDIEALSNAILSELRFPKDLQRRHKAKERALQFGVQAIAAQYLSALLGDLQ